MATWQALRRLTTTPRALQLVDYPHVVRLQTRWNDNDNFGHVNNALYYGYMDDAVNQHLARSGVGLDQRRFVVESGCRFLSPLAYPQLVDVGLRIERLGKSSARYALGLFGRDADEAPPVLCAEGMFVHVYVGDDGRPTPLPESVRSALSALQ